jgi:hypothetical protein
MNEMRAAHPTERWKSYLFAGGVCLASVAGYARSFDVPFQFDDSDQILHNPAIQNPTVAALVHWGRTRLIPYLTLALNWRIGADDPTGYHVVNLAIHLLASLLVFRLALALCDTPRLRGTAIADQRLALATSAAFVFACHPIQIQAVTYIVQRVSSLCALFYIGSVLAYVTAGNRSGAGLPGHGRAYAAAIAMAIGALLSKENAASLPVVLLLSDWFFRPTGLLRRTVKLWAPFALLASTAPLIWYFFWRAPGRLIAVTGPDATWLDKVLRAASPSGPVSPLEYFLTQCTVIPSYLRLVVLPIGLNVDHDVAIVRSVSVPVVAGFLLLAALVAFALYARRRWPLIGFGIAWLFATLAVESSFFPIGDPMMEHRMYLPMAGVSIALGCLFAAAFARRRMLSLAWGAPIAASLLALTIARNEVWRTELSLWSDAVAKSPGKARPHTNLGVCLEKAGKIDEAIRHYCTALEIDAEHPNVRRNLQIALQAKMDEALDAEETIDIAVDENGEIVVDVDEACRRQKAPAVPRLRLGGGKRMLESP